MDGTTETAVSSDEAGGSSMIVAAPAPAPARGYWLTRFLILRLLGLVYLVAFVVAARQAVPLIGERGLLPARLFLDEASSSFGSRAAAFLQFPSVFWLYLSDRALTLTAWCGAALSLAVLCGYANALMMVALWALYMSYVHVGQIWYGYGWEIQLLETGFLAIFLCPLLDARPFPRRATPVPVLWLMRWLIFRIMLGAGLIKMRGDDCWRDLTCLYYHYETQPIPNPLSRWLHFMPRWFHKAGVLFNHFTELIAPWFAFDPPLVRHAAGAVLLALQLTLIASGNLSFLNWLTIVPILACFDDRLLSRLMPRRLVERARLAAATAVPSTPQRWVVRAVCLLVAALSVYPVMNMMSGRQAMNAAFEPLSLVNTYGAFGSVGKERHEIVFEGTDGDIVSGGTVWKEYEFPCKPGDPMRRPCFISPYQPRLDWQIWFAAMATPEQYPWTIHFVWKLLHGDAGTLSLLANDPFPSAPPRYVRARLYRYRFAPPDDPTGAWWIREPLGDWLPPLSADDPRLRRYVAARGWAEPDAVPRP